MLQLLAGWNILVQVGVGPGDQPRQGRAGPQDRQRIRRRIITAEHRKSENRKVAATIYLYPPHGRAGCSTTSNDRRAVSATGKGAAESWLFVSPHDDDMVIGGGLTFQVGMAEGAQVHAVVVTDGRMGYCRFEQRAIDRRDPRGGSREVVRRSSACRPSGCSSSSYPDGNLNAYRGRHFTTDGDPTEIEGAGGMQNAFTYALAAGPARRGSSCPPAPICTPTTASSTRRC